MANKFITALFGDYSKKEVKRLGKTKQKVLDLEEKYQAMDDKELTAQTAVLKTRLADGETLDDILPDAFAVCREAAWRVLGMKHFPVQIVGGIVLHQGRIAETKDIPLTLKPAALKKKQAKEEVPIDIVEVKMPDIAEEIENSEE